MAYFATTLIKAIFSSFLILKKGIEENYYPTILRISPENTELIVLASRPFSNLQEFLFSSRVFVQVSFLGGLPISPSIALPPPALVVIHIPDSHLV